MQQEIHKFYSENLSKDVNISVYGHFGISLLVFPSINDESSDIEESGMLEAIAPLIEKGKFKVFTLPTVNNESWHNNNLSNLDKSKRHFEYNQFLVVDMLPFIYNQCGGAVPIITAGASVGAFHAANTYFRRPDIFLGTIALSPTFNIRKLTGGYFDENCYFNSPIDYIPNLNDEYWLSYLRSRKHVHLLSGSGEGENPNEIIHFSSVLVHKGISHKSEIWGNEYDHSHKTWNEMMKHTLSTKF